MQLMPPACQGRLVGWTRAGRAPSALIGKGLSPIVCACRMVAGPVADAGQAGKKTNKKKDSTLPVIRGKMMNYGHSLGCFNMTNCRLPFPIKNTYWCVNPAKCHFTPH